MILIAFNSISRRLLITSIIVALISCSGADPEPTLEELVMGEWTAKSIVRENSDVTSDFQGFTIRFDDGTYTSENGQHVWPESGTWSVANEGMMQLQRDNDLIMEAEADPNNLTLSFQIDENEFGLGGRTQTVSSIYVFTLTK